MQEILNFVCGGVGAILYGFPMYRSTRKSDPDALMTLLFVVFTGTVLAGIFTPVVGQVNFWGLKLGNPVPYPLATAIGLVANKLVPIFIQKVVDRANKS